MTKPNILIVEDEAIVAKNIEFMLKDFGYNVAGIVNTGKKAVEKTGENIDLILMDILLKGEMNGVQAAKAIHERMDIPVIYLTAHGESHIIAEAKITEPYGYLMKPFSERELKATIEVALYKHKAEKASRQAEVNETLCHVLQNFIGDALGNTLQWISLSLRICDRACRARNETPEMVGDLHRVIEGIDGLAIGVKVYQDFSRDEKKSNGTYGGSADLKSMLDDSLSGKPLQTYSGKDFPIPADVKVRFKYNQKQKGALKLNEVPDVQGNTYYVKKALCETVINAIESYASKEKGDVVISASKTDDDVLIHIRDNGRGMSGKELKLFHLPFYKILQAKNSTRLGLGEYIAHRAMEYCGGKIDTKSAPGVGTTKTMLFKVRAPHPKG